MTTTARRPNAVLNLQARDPHARGRLTALLIGTLLLWPLAVLAEFKPWRLFEPGTLKVMAGFLGGFMPPATSPDFLALLAKATLETLAMATAGIALAFVLAVPLALLMTHSLSISRIGPGPGRWRGATARVIARGVLTFLRAIPDVVWALVLVRALGLGPAAGVLALAITYGGMLGKVYAEILESSDTRPARALLEAGSGRLAALCYGLLPGAAQELASYTVYRWECAVRASVVMGFVGAGGLGQLMDQSMKMLNGGEASSILLVFLLLVLMADGLSAALRRVLAASPPERALTNPLTGHLTSPLPGALLRALPPAATGGLRAAWPCVGCTAVTALIAAAVFASFACLALDPRADYRALFGSEAFRAMGRFVAEFFPPDSSPSFLAKAAWGALQTLAVSALGTLLAVAAGGLLALPASGRHGALARHVARWVLNVLRSVPELVWAVLMVLAAGLGPFAGVLALALHTSGVLGRLFGEALENAPPAPERALREAGSGAVAAFAYGSLPLVLPQWLAYTLYRWEMNIRMAAVLGFVGAGGLGQMLYFHLSLFQQAQAATVLGAMCVLVIAVDALSSHWRRGLAPAHA